MRSVCPARLLPRNRASLPSGVDPLPAGEAAALGGAAHAAPKLQSKHDANKHWGPTNRNDANSSYAGGARLNNNKALGHL